ncbi:MAG: hypothetical protein RDU24_11990 [Humidesulfovibrio sp.]|uniref:hypothetical protein n=1 Tax=Humidesulfovibrio sp. TaxID=2910988 RepID=UPI0027EC9BD1|nr:hypothetical protein [Humidesulfovibrio sp.]MDQ7836095.1 hypothetical protein [Humidesulfovibrio sp.]
MFTKAGLLIAVALVLLGYRWGKRKAQERLAPPPVQAAAPSAAPKKEWISVRTLLVIVAILLVIAILSSLTGRIG